MFVQTSLGSQHSILPCFCQTLCNILWELHYSLLFTFCLCSVEASVPAMLSIAEVDGPVSVCVTLAITPPTATTSRNLTLNLATSDGTGNHYTNTQK